MVELHFVIPLTVVYVPNDHQTDGQSMTKPSWALDWFIFLPLTYMVVKYYIFYRYIYIYIYYIIWLYNIIYIQYIYIYTANKKMWDVSPVIAIFTRFCRDVLGIWCKSS